MSKIKLLPEHLINQIAAGEVVERPASVIKELLDNSIDANADRILVEVEEGGKKLIRVTDNGFGMEKEDVELALVRHATSKLFEESDLWKIRSMGFRGEALASISSVSRFKLRTQARGAKIGYQIEAEGENISPLTETSKEVGTQIEIRDLFFNTPARQKYLKKDSTELGHISTCINQLSLAFPNKSFCFIHNGKTVFDYPKVGSLKERIIDVYGKNTSDALLEVFYGSSELKISGYIGKPLLSRTSSKHQIFFVNKRPIQNHLLANSIKRAFHSMLMEHKKPIFFINIEIDPKKIDVNVHPRKLEIRFENDREMISILYGATKKALEKNVLMPKAVSESKNYMSDSFPSSENKSSASSSDISLQSRSMGAAYKSQNFGNSIGREIIRNKGESVKDAINFTKNLNIKEGIEQASFISENRENAGINQNIEIEEEKLVALAQVAKSYIIAKKGNEIVLIDQHAAHERIRFETLMKEFSNQNKNIQNLLVPQEIELSRDEVEIINENMDIFEGIGLKIEPFGGNSFVISEVPSCLAKDDLGEVINGVIDDIEEGKKPDKMQGKTEVVLTYMACRSAIKFGQTLQLIEMQTLLDELMTMKHPYTCPHGRPSMVSLDLKELGKMFGRIK